MSCPGRASSGQTEQADQRQEPTLQPHLCVSSTKRSGRGMTLGRASHEIRVQKKNGACNPEDSLAVQLNLRDEGNWAK
jgi:hypothetical protein